MSITATIDAEDELADAANYATISHLSVTEDETQSSVRRVRKRPSIIRRRHATFANGHGTRFEPRRHGFRSARGVVTKQRRLHPEFLANEQVTTF